MPKEFCFKCGKGLESKDVTREHIPAKAFYKGLPEEYKINLLTVPACFECNQRHAEIDDTMRDAIGIMNENNEVHSELTRKAVKSIIRKSKYDNLFFDEDGKVRAVEFELQRFIDSALKTHYGIFYEAFGEPLPDTFSTEIIYEGKHFGQMEYFENEVVAKYGWIAKGHQDVFRYQIKDIKLDKNQKLYSAGTYQNSIAVLSVMIFYNQFKFYGFSADNKFKEEAARRAGLIVN